MPTNYEQKIVRYSLPKVRQLWRLIEAGQTVNESWEAGKAFEYLVLRAFQIEGAKIRWPFRVSLDGDEIEQIDGTVYTDGLACLIECKDQITKMNVEPVAKLRNQLLRRPRTAIGLVFSRHGFTDPALTLARFTASHPILLWTGEEVTFSLERKYFRKGLLAKYRRCIEEGLPDYNIRTEVIP